jgi:ethanolamine ammonia-lyase small subunit
VTEVKLPVAQVRRLLDDLMRPAFDQDGLATALRALTPARILLGSAGTSYPTEVLLALRADHSAARDAATSSLDVTGSALRGLVEKFGLFTVQSCAATRAEYLRRPDLGRRLSPQARATILAKCMQAPDVQVFLGDGLSPAALIAQAPRVVADLFAGARARRWNIGRPFVIENCRVGQLNEIGDVLRPRVAILLVGERPGMSTARSMSAYLAYRPAPGHTDADRKLVSNIHEDGLAPADAAEQILAFADAMVAAESRRPIRETSHRPPVQLMKVSKP